MLAYDFLICCRLSWLSLKETIIFLKVFLLIYGMSVGGKQEYVEEKLYELTRTSLVFFLPFGCAVFLLLSILDYFVTPDNFLRFLLYRIVVFSTGMLLFAYLKFRKNIGRRFLIAAILVTVFTPSLMVELMILSFGGHQSIYSVGMIVVFLFVVGFIPLSMRLATAVSLLMFMLYLLPVVFLDTITNTMIFINNSMFFIACIIGGIVLKHYNYKLLVRDFSREYDLSLDRQQLEGIVGVRTRELSISEQKLMALFENATDGILITDHDGTILEANHEACSMHGFSREALSGAKIELLDSSEDKSVMRERLKRILGGEQLLFETSHYRKDGSRVSLEVSAKAIQVEDKVLIQYFLRDITERKMLEAQVLQSQKLDSIGSFAGGIAHNFNNILTAILGYAEVLQSSGTLEEGSRQRIKNIETCARKAGIMVSTLLDFTRNVRSKILPLNINDVVRESMKLVEGFLDQRIRVKMFLDPEIPVIEGDDNRLGQVMMNLIANARDSMPEGGTITIRTATVEVKNERLDMQVYIPPGKYVLLKISDTGFGISKEIITKVFDPFFTTKDKGKGTGLGLAIVYVILKDHNGYITVQSEAGRGTCFDIYLPVSKQCERRIEQPEPISLEGHENILLVDDDEDILNFIRDILETHGYTVLSVNNPVSAADLFRELSGKIPLVITDIIMPMMDGSELVTHLKKISPSVRIVVISGFGGREIKKDNRAVDAFLKKPFEVSDLLLTVRRLLNEREKNARI